MTDIGILYVLANRDNSLAKVGLTRNGTPDARADDYSREHGIQWRVYWVARTANVGNAEARAHAMLANWRFSHIPDAREIFHTTPAKAKAFAEQCITPVVSAEEQARVNRHAAEERVSLPSARPSSTGSSLKPRSATRPRRRPRARPRSRRSVVVHWKRRVRPAGASCAARSSWVSRPAGCRRVSPTARFGHSALWA